MIRISMALVLILHGLVHLLGFVVPWRLATVANMPYTTTLLDGNLEIGAVGMRVVGVLWLLGAVGFVATGAALLARVGWWPTLALAVTLCSLILTLLGWPDSFFGTIVNGAILAFLFLGTQRPWRTLPQQAPARYRERKQV